MNLSSHNEGLLLCCQMTRMGCCFARRCGSLAVSWNNVDITDSIEFHCATPFNAGVKALGALVDPSHEEAHKDQFVCSQILEAHWQSSKDEDLLQSSRPIVS